MGLVDFLKRLFDTERGKYYGRPVFEDKWDVNELARRLGVSLDQLINLTPAYDQFSIPKRSGDKRIISAPKPELKRMQRAILRRLLTRLKSHPKAVGFEPGCSIVTNAVMHVDSAVVLRMDIREFFTSTSSDRIRDF
ncbi:MAG: RNA-dependent RNA polymerase family protein, partial [Planctomycetota bacterium]